MRKLILSAGIALVSGVICFFLSVAFLAFVLLFIRVVGHTQPDMTLTYKAAVPVAILASLCGFIITLVRSFRSSARSSAAQK
jgi:H+/Cl- antiporter ClcA